MHKLLFFIFLLSGPFVWSQQSFSLITHLIDASSGETINDAEISVEQGVVRFQNSNGSGSSFKLYCTGAESSFRVQVNHEAFQSIDTTIIINCQTVKKKKREVELTLLLKFDGQTTEGVDISSEYKPEIVFSSEEFSVQDFQIDAQGRLFLLIYNQRMEKGSQLTLLENGVLKYHLPIAPGHHELQRDYLGRVFLVGNNEVHLVSLNDRLVLNPVNKADYEYHIAPIIDTFQQKLYFSNYNDWYPAVDFFEINVTSEDTVYSTLHHVEDHVMMEHFLAEYKWADVRTQLWAWDRERETGIDREIWVGLSSFTQTVYFEPIYANFFIVDNQFYISDHYDDLLFSGSLETGKISDSVPINYHLKKGRFKWKRATLQDELTKKVYCRYDYVGRTQLSELNLKTGKTNLPFELHYEYVEKIMVFNDEVYYIYRPFESAQKKYLYKERLADLLSMEKDK